MSDGLDLTIAVAIRRTVQALELEAAEHGLEKLTEVKHLKPAFRDALLGVGLDGVQMSEKRLRFPSWEPRGVKGRLGGVDVIVGAEPDYRAFFELKWARGTHELGWTLWDTYKLAAARMHYGVSAYVVVGAPNSFWSDDAVPCVALYCDSTWSSQQLFSHYEEAWGDLLTGGTARPSRVPVSITTRLVASARLETSPRWELRALRIDVTDDGWLEFDGDWPVGHQPGRARAPAVPAGQVPERRAPSPLARTMCS